MQEFLTFALIGLGIGAVYSLASQGLILIYRGSGVLNFAHGGIGMAGAYVTWDLQTNAEAPFAVAFVAGVGMSALLGALTYLGVVRWLGHASALARIVATLGVLIAIQAVVVLRYGTTTTIVPSELPTDPLTLFGSVMISADRVILFGIAATLSVVLWAAYRFTEFGIGTSAVAENPRGASALGWSPSLIATANWTLGSALAGLGAILVTPITQLQVGTMTNLVLAAMAAALIAGFRSFAVAFGAGIAIGVGQALLVRYTMTPGLPQSLPFVLIVLTVALSGRALPLRDQITERLPVVGTGRVRLFPAGIGIAVAVTLILTLSATWVDAFVVTFGVALVLLSIVVLTGYAGQISLGQFALAGSGAYIAGRLVAGEGWPFLPAMAVGVLGAVPIGVLFALPAVRTRGISLAVVTLGLGTAIELMVFNNDSLTGGIQGTQVGSPTLFGLDINSVVHPERYAIFALAAFVLAALAVASVRRGRSGRRLIAVRTNERAAAALGINVMSAKLFAFSLSAAIAALGGVVLAFKNPTIVYSEFESFQSIVYVGYAVIGGIGFCLGPVVGALFAAGALGTEVAHLLFGDIGDYVQLVAGGLLILMILQNPDGIVREQLVLAAKVKARFTRDEAVRDETWTVDLPKVTPVRVAPKHLQVRDLVVRYGGVVAADGVSLDVRPGQVVGLIGPNGAGKTTVIDAVTGFAPVASGTITMDGISLTGKRADVRARFGLSRSFQSLELFEDMTVLDNLRAAAEPRDQIAYLKDLVWPAVPPLPSAVVAAIEAFKLQSDLEKTVSDLPYGQRRLVAIARAIATGPSVLLLDEPAAGLSEHESAELAGLVRGLADRWGIAILLVEHDMTFVRAVCDHIEVIDFGRPIAGGAPAAVIADPSVIAAYLGEEDDDVVGPTRTKGQLEVTR